MAAGKYIIQFWDFISRRGVTDESTEDTRMIMLMNRVAVLSAFGAWITSATIFWTTRDTFYIATMSATIVYGLIPILHHFHKIQWVRFYCATVLTLWYVLILLCIGGNVSQSAAGVAIFVLTYVLLDKHRRLRVPFLIYNIAIHIFAEAYLVFYPPLFGVRDYPLDEIIVFLLCVSWIYVILLVYESEKEALIKNLREKNEVLELATEELERFTYVASHDLKSPLRNVIGLLGMTRRKIEKGQYDDNLLDDIELAKEGAEQMYQLVNDMRELSRMNINSQEQREWTDLNDVIQKSIDNLQQDISEKNAVINIPDLPNYLCNSVEFTIVFQNLIQNGIKYNESTQPIVNIQTEQTNNQLRIHFEDNGIGMKEEYFDSIFEYFKRLHTEKKYKGTGLGLGLCKKIIQNYNGNISVQSRIGEGSVFTIQLPHIAR